jgi:hypothetical protein
MFGQAEQELRRTRHAQSDAVARVAWPACAVVDPGAHRVLGTGHVGAIYNADRHAYGSDMPALSVPGGKKKIHTGAAHKPGTNKASVALARVGRNTCRIGWTWPGQVADCAVGMC